MKDLLAKLGGSKSLCKAANITDLYHGGLSNLANHGMGAAKVVGQHVGDSVGDLVKRLGAGARNVGGALHQTANEMGHQTADVANSLAGIMREHPVATGGVMMGAGALGAANQAKGIYDYGQHMRQQLQSQVPAEEQAIKRAFDMYKISAPMVPGLMGKIMGGAQKVMASPVAQGAGQWARKNPALAGAGVGAIGGAVAGGEGNRMQGAASGAMLGGLGGQMHASGAFGRR